MPEAVPPVGVLRFGVFLADLRSGELYRDGSKVKLQDQPFRVLQLLAEHPGQVVTREELQRHIWPADTFVDFDRGLNNAVKRLREALGDTADTPRYIETLPKRGYRFIAPLQAPTPVAGEPESVVASAVARPRHRPILTAAACGFVLVPVLAAMVASNVGGLRDRVFGTPAAEIHARLTRQDNPSVLPPRPLNVKALEAYLLGKHHLDRVGRGAGDEEIRKAAACFRQATEIDPDFTQAYRGLSAALSQLWAPTSEDFALETRTRQRLAVLDPNPLEWTLRAAREKAKKWDWAGAEKEYRTAIAINPNSVEAHRALAKFLDFMGRLDEGWKEQQIAQQLDPQPGSMAPALDLPEALIRRGEYDRAIELLTRVQEIQPDDGQTHFGFADCYEGKGLYQESIQELGKAAASYGHAEIAGRLLRVFATSGFRAALRQWTAEIERVQRTKEIYVPGYLAVLYARLEDRERALSWLEQALSAPNKSALDWDGAQLFSAVSGPSWKSIRADSRYSDLLRRFGLQQ